MAVTRSVTRKKNQDEYHKKRAKALEDIASSPWSNLMEDFLFLVLLRLGVSDFASFSGVCKRWRSIANSNRNKFIATRQPMSLSFSTVNYKKHCYFEDIDKSRKIKISIPHSMGRTCVGVTCGYLILHGTKAYDFWLVNPFTRHELHFPRYPVHDPVADIKGILVFSPSLSGLVFMVSQRPFDVLSFCLAGKEAASWKHIFFNFPIHDIQFFKGKIYTLNKGGHLFEVRFKPIPHITLVEVNTLKGGLLHKNLVSWGENLYVMGIAPGGDHGALLLDFDQKKPGCLIKMTEKHALFVNMKCRAGVDKVSLWVDPDEQYKRYGHFHGNVNHTGKVFHANMWYFPHDCLSGINRVLE